MAKRPTITDVASAAGVSVATVDRVLSGRHKVRPDTAERVFQAAQAVGFRATTLIQHRLADAERPEMTLGLILQRPDQGFYQQFKAEVERAAALAQTARIRLMVEFRSGQDPDETIARLRMMAARGVSAIGMTSIEHHRITEEVASLRQSGIPVFALLSDFAPGLRHAYIGIDNLRVGRTAAWMIARGLRRPNPKVALLVGGHRWHGHSLREAGFRAYFRENAPSVEVLDTQVTLDATDLSYETVSAILARQPDLAGIYCAGGGMEGMLRALRDEAQGRRIEAVANELTDDSRPALADGLLSLAIGTPLRALSEALITRMIGAARGIPGEESGDLFLPMDLHLPESI